MSSDAHSADCRHEVDRLGLVARALHHWNGYKPEDCPFERLSQDKREDYRDQAEFVLAVLDSGRLP